MVSIQWIEKGWTNTASCFLNIPICLRTSQMRKEFDWNAFALPKYERYPFETPSHFPSAKDIRSKHLLLPKCEGNIWSTMEFKVRKQQNEVRNEVDQKCEGWENVWLEHQECIFSLNKRSGIGWEQFQIDSKAQTTILPKFEGSFQILSGMVGSQIISLSMVGILYCSSALPNGIETSMKRYFGEKCFQSCSDRASNCQTPKILQTN